MNILEQALEALESIYVDDEGFTVFDWPKRLEAIAALKESIANDTLKRQWQREALLEAIDCARNAYESGDVLERLINMAKELE